MPRSGWFRKRQPALAADGTTASKPSWPRLSGQSCAAWTAGGTAMILVVGVVIVTFASPAATLLRSRSGGSARARAENAGDRHVIHTGPTRQPVAALRSGVP